MKLWKVLLAVMIAVMICSVAMAEEHKHEKAYEKTGLGYHNVVCKCGEVLAKGEECSFEDSKCVFCGFVKEADVEEAPVHVCTKKVYEPGDLEVHVVVCPECKEQCKEEHTYENNVCICGMINPETPVVDIEHKCTEKTYEWTGLGYHNVICPECFYTVKGVECEYAEGKCIYCGDAHKHTAKTYEWTGLGYHNVICPDCGEIFKGLECEYAEGKCIYCGDAHKHTAKTYEWTGHGYHNVICPDCGEIFKGLECEYEDRVCIYCGDELPAETKWYYNNTMTSFGPMTRELVGGKDWHRVTPVDLTVDGVYTCDLIASNKYVVGKVTITVKEGALSVNYKAKYGVEITDEALLIYASKADLAEGVAVTAEVGAEISIADTFGEDAQVLVSLILTGNYDALVMNTMNAAGAAGMIATIE